VSPRLHRNEQSPRILRPAFVLLTNLLVAGCGTTSDTPERESLQAFGSCGDLERHIKDDATRRMNEQIDQFLRGVYPVDSTRGISPPTAAAAAPAATDYSTTNTQERGVDEPDIVKNDGSRLFVLHAGQLVILRAWPPEALSIESVTALNPPATDSWTDSVATDMLLDGNTLVVFSNNPVFYYLRQTAGTFAPGGGAPAQVRMSVFDVSRATPVKLYELSLAESYMTARRTGHLVRLVSASGLVGPELQYYPSGSVNWNDRGAVNAAYEALRKANRDKIRKSTLDDWLPRISETFPGAAPRDVTRECSAILAAGAPTSQGLTTVSTVDLAHLSGGAGQTTILSPADVVYASTRSLYVATVRYPWSSDSRANDEARTFIHKLDVSGASVDYEATGSVPGYVADQFSLDEEGAFLRVATTRQGTSNGTVTQAASSGVYVLHSTQGTLSVIGQVTGLAPGETLYAARFLGTRGYLVTFRRVDPLFTLDLLRPSDPRVAGELKVPGFSTYLHPLDDQHLLTIGREVSEDGRTQGGVMLEVFDVGDLKNPRLQHKLAVGTTRSGSSDAGYDHKAFNFFSSRNLLAIPYSDYTSSARGYSYRSSIEVFRVTPQDGIQPLGSVDHDGVAGSQTYPGWSPQVRRSVMMEDFVYSISSSGVKVNDTRAAMRTVATVPLPQP
jgi:uncharacterized secreted protein with C-terminal beta-propeller domain